LDKQNRTARRTARAGKSVWNSQERRARKGLLDHDIKYWKTGMELAEHDKQNQIGRTGLPGQDCQDRAARTGRPEQYCKDRTLPDRRRLGRVNDVFVIVLHVLARREERRGEGSSGGWVKDLKWAARTEVRD
jgi:hypothetical protein